MRIVHLVDSLEPGGAERIVWLLCRAYRERGHQAGVVCLFGIGGLGEELRQQGFAVELCAARGFLAQTVALRKAFGRLQPEVVHCHNVVATTRGAAPARLAGARVISTRHGLVPAPYLQAQEVKYSLAARLCSALVGVCDATSQNLRGAPLAARGRIVTIYNGADIHHGSGEARPRAPGEFRLAHVARLSAIKNQDGMLRGVALARKQVAGLTLDIIGDGPERANLERLNTELGLGDAVRFCGHQSSVGPFLQAADAFLLPSHSEGLPMSLLEAMAAGLPALVSDVGGMSEVLRKFECGILLPEPTPPAIAAAIAQCAGDEGARARWAANARAAHAQHFSVARMAESYLQLYAQALSSGPR